ncbi:MAG: hypothetical protein M5R40_06590 [Anaerolineae bacterium]|nr:hypothetical protein [Anaerolineae bacterium]
MGWRRAFRTKKVIPFTAEEPPPLREPADWGFHYPPEEAWMYYWAWKVHGHLPHAGGWGDQDAQRIEDLLLCDWLVNVARQPIPEHLPKPTGLTGL